MKTRFILNSILTFSFLALIASSCTTAKISADELQRAKKLSPPEGKALLYVVRPGKVGSSVAFGITAGGTSLGSVGGKRFIYAFLDPGKHQLVSKAENEDEVILETVAGKTYFLQLNPKMGLWYARSEWERIDEAKGKKALAKCKMSGDCPAHGFVK